MGCTDSKDKKNDGGGDKCDHCKKGFGPAATTTVVTLPGGKQSGKLHPACKDNWSEKNAKDCDYCDKPMIKAMVEVSGGDWSGKVHPECEVKFCEKKQEKYGQKSKCDFCKGGFEGSEQVHVISTDDDKAHLHKGCIDKWHRKKGRVCDHCHEVISGTMATIDGPKGKAKLHPKCLRDYKDKHGL